MKIGEILLRDRVISQEQLDLALQAQQKTHDRLGDIVLKMGFATPESMAPILAKYFDIPFVRLGDIYKDIKSNIIDAVAPELAQRFHVIPIALENHTLTVATFDPLDLIAIDTLRLRTGYKVRCVVSPENEIIEAVDYCYNYLPRLEEHVENFNELEVKISPVDTAAEPEEGQLAFAATDQPVVQYAKSLIVQAVNNRASDIHLQPKENKVELCFRTDGVLHHMNPPPKAMLPAITTRIKILAGLDIAEKRLPQDGRFRVKIGKGEIDIRVSCFPTIYGESIVLRLLDTSAPLLGLEQLGIETQDMRHYQDIIFRSYGLILVTGPTGSGKTTTLYTTLNQIKADTKNIITLEDPVEYRLTFIQQTQVNTQIGLDFARGLRSILRQDPDVIMVGEIRDRETAEIAIHSALTGHLVFSTLHTNDAASASVRLTNMGVEPFLITSSLLGVLAQRLIRTICPHCKERVSVAPKVLEDLGLSANDQIYKGKGCSRCLKSGYLGRMGVYELLIPNEGMRQMILNRRSSEEIRSVAQKEGMKSLRQAAVLKVKQGMTTPQEVLRITQDVETS
ncbi:MAG: type II/IV secretion system protein [Candidatus Omnitrophica bacterium]|nr:type II/IV secretion system protein [Candidatus Omnitrophota bacterium]